MTTNNLNYQENHLDFLKQKFTELANKPDGFLYYEPSGIHFIVVEKKDNFILLGLIDQVNFSSQLTQSEFNLNDPLTLTADYSKAVILSLLWQNNPEKIYLAGLGGGRIPLFFYHYFPEIMINCTEIEPNLITIANQFFGLEFDQRLTVNLEDGRAYLSQLSPEIKYDIIITDVVLGNGYSPYKLFTEEFYHLCQDHLSDQGVVVVNLVKTDPYLWEKIKTIQNCFQGVYLCDLTGNMVIIATNQQILKPDEIVQKAQNLQEKYQFSFSILDVASLLKPLTDEVNLLAEINQVNSLKDNDPPENYFDNLPSFNTFFAKVNPDNPCPCGSGKLFKHCHFN